MKRSVEWMQHDMVDRSSRDCPVCGFEMKCDTRIYGRIYQCDRESCENMEVYFEIVDKQLYLEQVKKSGVSFGN